MGESVGVPLGDAVGLADGAAVDKIVGAQLGLELGDVVRLADGAAVGEVVGV